MVKNYNENNIFAKILRAEMPCNKVLENKYALSFIDINPKAPIHMLVIPKNPYVDFHDFNENANSNEILSFWRLVNEIVIKKEISNQGFRIITNSGADGNQEVLHFHIHILAGKNLGVMIN